MPSRSARYSAALSAAEGDPVATLPGRADVSGRAAVFRVANGQGTSRPRVNPDGRKIRIKAMMMPRPISCEPSGKVT